MRAAGRMRAIALLAAATLCVPAGALEARSGARANPIRKVVNMLKMMEVKVAEEGDKKKELFEKAACSCKKTTADLQASMAEADDRIPQLSSSLQEVASLHQQLQEDVKQHQQDRAEAAQAVQSGKGIRVKEADAFAKESAEMKANIDALGQAVEAVQKGQASFLQTEAAASLKKLLASMDVESGDREVLSAFLSTGQATSEVQSYAPQSGEILGILKQMREEMGKELEEAEKEEASSQGNHQTLLAAKEKEIAAATKAIETKTGRVGDLAVQKTTLANDLDDATEARAQDAKLLAQLTKSCAAKAQEWEEYQQTQAQEQVAIAETIKMLNDDSSLDLFKKTLSKKAESFLQVRSVARPSSQRASTWLRRARRRDGRVNFLEQALRGKRKGFDAVMQKIDALAGLLREEQATDDQKKDFCIAELDKTEQEGKETQRKIDDTQSFVAETADSLKEVQQSIASLVAGIQELDKQVAEATETRKEEHAESVEILASNNAAKTVIDKAKNRLRKFYQPKLYKEPLKKKLSEEDQIAENFNSAAAFVQVSSHAASVVEQEPEDADLTYKKSSEESGGVMAMMDVLKSDLEKQIVEVQADERHAQADYEEFLKNSADKRAVDSKAVADQEEAKAELEAAAHTHRGDLKVHKKSRRTTTRELGSLHQDCDWLLQNHGARKEARADEADSLQKAKAVLAGADFS